MAGFRGETLLNSDNAEKTPDFIQVFFTLAIIYLS